MVLMKRAIRLKTSPCWSGAVKVGGIALLKWRHEARGASWRGSARCPPSDNHHADSIDPANRAHFQHNPVPEGLQSGDDQVINSTEAWLASPSR